MKIAGFEDFEEVKELVWGFIKQTPHIYKLSTEEGVDQFLRSMLEAPKDQQVIILTEGGMIAGVSVPSPFGPYLIATELGWYLKEEYRGKGTGQELLEAFEYWAKNVAGCQAIQMSSLDENIGKYYEKKGYKLVEKAYIKE